MTLEVEAEKLFRAHAREGGTGGGGFQTKADAETWERPRDNGPVSPRRRQRAPAVRERPRATSPPDGLSCARGGRGASEDEPLRGNACNVGIETVT